MPGQGTDAQATEPRAEESEENGAVGTRSVGSNAHALLRYLKPRQDSRLFDSCLSLFVSQSIAAARVLRRLWQTSKQLSKKEHLMLAPW